MIARTFLNSVANGQVDMVQLFLDALEETQSNYCAIGGLAVNAYAEPVVSLDLDVVVVSDKVNALCETARAKGMKLEKFEHSVNFSLPGSDLRIPLQTAPRYQAFLGRAVRRQVLGYEMFVASLEDVLQGKLWAYTDKTKRPSNRQKDLADILRLVEAHPFLQDRIPKDIRAKMEG